MLRVQFQETDFQSHMITQQLPTFSFDRRMLCLVPVGVVFSLQWRMLAWGSFDMDWGQNKSMLLSRTGSNIPSRRLTLSMVRVQSSEICQVESIKSESSRHPDFLSIA